MATASDNAELASGNAYWNNGQRFANNPNTLASQNSDPGTLARENGYAGIDEAVQATGIPADQLVAQWTSNSPAIGDQQVADSDKSYGPLVLKILAGIGLGGAGAAGIGALAAGGGAAGAAGAGTAAATGGSTAAGTAGAGLGLGATGGGLSAATFGGVAAPTIAATGAGAGTAAATGAGGLASLLGGGSTVGGLADLALKAGSGIASGLEQNSQFQQQQAAAAAALKQQNDQFNATLGQTQATNALTAQSQDPFAQAKDREGQALLSAILSNYSPVTYANGKLSGGTGANLNPTTLANVAAFASPSAMQANENQFNSNASTASGGKYTPPAADGSNGYSAIQALMAKLNPNSTPAGGAQ